MIASEILMSIGSTTASMLNGPTNLSPTDIKLSENLKLVLKNEFKPMYMSLKSLPKTNYVSSGIRFRIILFKE